VSAGDPYVYPDAPDILRNKFGIKDAARLDAAESEHVAQRIEEGVPLGEFDLAHIKAIHKHLFQDMYEWAGKLRTVELSKGGHHFQPVGYIETGIENIHGRLIERTFLVGWTSDAFAREAAQIIGDLNYVHPFREGNGRTQLQYLKLLSRRAGLDIDLTRLKPDEWQKASRAAHVANYDPMRAAILGALTDHS
jgi:cell filamentation protein